MRGTASRLASNIGLGRSRIQATAAFAGSIHVICRLYRLAWQTLSFVIPGRAPWREPGIHTPGRGYGFRARDFVAPRNDDAKLALHRHLAMQHRRARRQALGGVDDGVGVDAVGAIEIVDGAGLAELLDAERLDSVAADAAEPAERCRVSVDHGDD